MNDSEGKKVTYWTPDIGRKNQEQLIKIMRDKQAEQICGACQDTGMMFNGEGTHAEPMPCYYCSKGAETLADTITDMLLAEHERFKEGETK